MLFRFYVIISKKCLALKIKLMKAAAHPDSYKTTVAAVTLSCLATLPYIYKAGLCTVVMYLFVFSWTFAWYSLPGV